MSLKSQIKRFFLLSLSFFNLEAYADPPNWDEWDEKMWLVHASPIMMEESTVKAGALNWKETGREIVPEDVCIHARMTHHHCLGGLARDDLVVVTCSFLGISFPSSLGEAISKRFYVYMAPWGEFEGKIIGGSPMDTFLFGDHTYGPQSIAFMPSSEEAKFRMLNPTFQGVLISYDTETQSVRDLVDQALRRKGAWRLEYRGGKEKPEDQIFIDGEPCDCQEFLTVYKSKTPYQGHHDYSPFGLLEKVFSHFNQPFGAIHEAELSLKGTFTRDPHAQHLRLLTGSLFDQAEELVSPERGDVFRRWKAGTVIWIDLYFQLRNALDSGRRVEGAEGFKHLLSLRGKEEELGTFFDGLPLKTERQPSHYRSTSPMFVPDYMEAFSAVSFETFRTTINAFSKEFPQFMNLMKVGFAIQHILRQEDDEKDQFAELLDEALPHISAPR